MHSTTIKGIRHASGNALPFQLHSNVQKAIIQLEVLQVIAQTRKEIQELRDKYAAEKAKRECGIPPE